MNDEYLSRPGKPRLRYCVFEPPTEARGPDGAARGAVFLTPGFSEHVGRYVHVAELWSRRGFVVAVHDPRGQGLSAGEPGHIARFSDWVDDALAVLEGLAKRPLWRAAGAPILFGHSLGALISSHVVLRRAIQPRAFACTSPFFGLGLKPPSWQVILAGLLTRIVPRYSEPTTIAGHYLTHDVERARAIDADPLRIRRVTARWFTETRAAQRELAARVAEVDLPVFCLQAEDDRVASAEASRRIVGKFPRGQFELAPGCYHELHQELDWQSHMTRFVDIFDSWCG